MGRQRRGCTEDERWEGRQPHELGMIPDNSIPWGKRVRWNQRTDQHVSALEREGEVQSITSLLEGHHCGLPHLEERPPQMWQPHLKTLPPNHARNGLTATRSSIVS